MSWTKEQKEREKRMEHYQCYKCQQLQLAIKFKMGNKKQLDEQIVLHNAFFHGLHK